MRATPADVVAIFPTSVDVIPYLMTASTLVDVYLGASGLSVALLFEIERWLTAHLVALAHGSGGGVTQRKIGDTSISYGQAQLGTGLASTRFGQTVLALDPTGELGNVGAKRALLKVD